MNKTEALEILVAQAERGELVFLTNVANSLRIKQAIDDPDCGVNTASKIVMNDPLLAARVVAVANSVAYSRMDNEVTSVKSAIMRLGFRTLRSIVASLIVRQLAGTSKNPVIRAMVKELWEHSAQVAALTQVMARRVTKLDPDTAMFAGIVHEIGGFYLLSRAEEFPCLLERDDWSMPPAPSELAVFTDEIIEKESAEATIGRAVLKNLQLPQAVMEAIEALWYGMRVMPPESLGDILLLANELATTPSPLDTRTDTVANRHTADIDFVVGDGSLAGILEESEDELKSLTAALII